MPDAFQALVEARHTARPRDRKDLRQCADIDFGEPQKTHAALARRRRIGAADCSVLCIRRSISCGVGMNKRLKRVLAWGSATIVIILGGLYAELVREMLHYDPNLLLGCMEADSALHGWTCEQVLRHSALTPDTVAELNRQGGALHPALLQDTRKAEEMLALFVSRGVDINAGNRDAKNLTALHRLVQDSNVARAKLLLKFGARTDVRTESGLLPVDLARSEQQKRPDDPAANEMVRLLEAPANKPAL